MAQNPRIIIDAFNYGGEEAIAETRDILENIAKIYRHDAELPSKREKVLSLLPTILETVSTINLARYTIEELKQLADGKGGVAEVLSITLNVLFFLNRYKEQLRIMKILGEINKMLMVYGVVA